jgi:hypothetical protein
MPYPGAIVPAQGPAPCGAWLFEPWADAAVAVPARTAAASNAAVKLDFLIICNSVP